MGDMNYIFIVLEFIVIIILLLKGAKDKALLLKEVEELKLKTCELDDLKLKTFENLVQDASLSDFITIRRKLLNKNERFTKSYPKLYNIPIDDFYVFIGVNFKDSPQKYNNKDFDVGAFLLNKEHQLTDSKDFIFYNNPFNNGVFLSENIIGPDDFGYDLSNVESYDSSDFLYVNLKEISSEIDTIVLSGFLSPINETFTNILDVNLIIWNRWNRNYKSGNMFSYKQDIKGALTNCFEVGEIVRNSDMTWSFKVNIEESELGIAGIASKYVQSEI